MRVTKLKHQFVESFPRPLEPGVLYISIRFSGIAHACACGCGGEVITPLTPTDWRMTYDGETVSLTPSIGNWSFPCRSHYWVKRSAVEWSFEMSGEAIEAGRRGDRMAKERYYQAKQPAQLVAENDPVLPNVAHVADKKISWARRIVNWLRHR